MNQGDNSALTHFRVIDKGQGQVILRTHKYVGKSPTTGSPYSMDFPGADPARRNGAVFRWEE